MKTFFLALFLISFSTKNFSQNITATAEYETSYWQCSKCMMTGTSKELSSILAVSDYRHLPSICLTAYEGGEKYGCVRDKYLVCSNGGQHRLIQTKPPTYERQELKNISKDRYNGQLVNSDKISEVCTKIKPDFLKWKDFYEAEQAQKEAERNKQNEEIAQKNEQAKRFKEFQLRKDEGVLDSLFTIDRYIEAYDYLNEKFINEPLTQQDANSFSTFKGLNNYFDAIGRGEIKKEGGTDVCTFGRCDKFSECGICRQSNSIYCKGHNEQYLKMSNSNKLYNKWNTEFNKHIISLLDEKVPELDRLVNFQVAQSLIDFYTKKERYVNKEAEQNQINIWNEKIRIIENLFRVDEIKKRPLNEKENLFIGTWNFESKKIRLNSGSVVTLEEVWSVNKDRTYIYESKFKNTATNSYYGFYKEVGIFEIIVDNFGDTYIIANITEENNKPSKRIDKMKFDKIESDFASRTISFKEAESPVKISGKKIK